MDFSNGNSLSVSLSPLMFRGYFFFFFFSPFKRGRYVVDGDCLMRLLIPKFSDFPKEIIKVSSYLRHADTQMAAGRDLEDKGSNP